MIDSINWLLDLRYVEVDEENGTELFYYFVESEAGAEKAPFLLWLTGGDRCTVLSGLALEIGTPRLRSQALTRQCDCSLTSYYSMHVHGNCRSIPVRRRALQRHSTAPANQPVLMDQGRSCSAHHSLLGSGHRTYICRFIS